MTVDQHNFQASWRVFRRIVEDPSRQQLIPIAWVCLRHVLRRLAEHRADPPRETFS
jgi:hypothetical protein